MATTAIEIVLDRDILAELDRLVCEGMFPSRSRAIQVAVEDKLPRLKRGRLAAECAKLDPMAEKAMAEDGMSGELSGWPEY